MMSQKGLGVLEELWTAFREEYTEQNPGCNLNDCERAFLHMVWANIMTNLEQGFPWNVARHDKLLDTEEKIASIV